jgi:oligopeptide transport system ATP-binding protein
MIDARKQATTTTEEPGPSALIDIEDLSVEFSVGSGTFFSRNRVTIQAVDDVSLTIYKGECLGLVGESGSGKTTLGRAILLLQRATSGQVLYEGQSIDHMRGSALRTMRRKMQIIFQDPYSSLDPRMSAGAIIGEGISIHNLAPNRPQYNRRVAELLEMVGLNSEMASRYPHEFSGGQRQRIGIARALAVEPDFIVCDEPVSALDVSIQAQILSLLAQLRSDLGLTYLFVAHDLSVVRHISDRVAVMYLGRIVEVASSADLYSRPLHPYTYALISGIPIPDPRIEAQRERVVLGGEVANPANPPSGCHFHPRCPFATDQCAAEKPQLRKIDSSRFVSCHRAEELLLEGV